MDQQIVAPSDEWITYIAKMWLLACQISEDVSGQKLDGTLDDLARLQAIIDSEQIPKENTQELQSLGIALGKVFVNDTPNYDWWIVNDEYGEDACVRYKRTNLLVFPQTMISKRLEDDEKVDISDIYTGLKDSLERIRAENYPNA